MQESVSGERLSESEYERIVQMLKYRKNGRLYSKIF
ncbi:hypothetical protein J2128_001596 [Methanomicrobium sp. W14]|nr:hypothetical protein [Methanomicrobium sp. W14]